eukprot:5571417-Heterocapsa_arctica.AAC.1
MVKRTTVPLSARRRGASMRGPKRRALDREAARQLKEHKLARAAKAQLQHGAKPKATASAAASSA